MFHLTGTLKIKNDEQRVSEKFRKREFVITDTNSQYLQPVLFQLTNDRCGLIDQFQTGEMIKVHFNVRGREWTSPQGDIRYFVSLDAWKLEPVNAQQPSPAPVNENYQAASNSGAGASDTDDLPF